MRVHGLWRFEIAGCTGGLVWLAVFTILILVSAGVGSIISGLGILLKRLGFDTYIPFGLLSGFFSWHDNAWLFGRDLIPADYAWLFMMPNKFCLGLTGGIGSGKTTIVNLFAEAGKFN